MLCRDVIKYIEDWAPPGIAWERDNTGLQVGSTTAEVKNILLCLDINEKVVDEAIKKKCNLIISHHPLLFHPIKRIDTDHDDRSKIIEKLLKNNITFISEHTNLDFTKEGVSWQLAKKLRLADIQFLKNLKSNLNKVSVFVPEDNLEDLAESIHSVGAGRIGNYTNCSFRTAGTGTFKGTDESNPSIGKKNQIEKVEEVKLEFLVEDFLLSKTIKKIYDVHPYEEPAYDIYPLKNENVNYGMGAIGKLNKPVSVKDFLKHVSKSLGIIDFRFTNGKKEKISRVAVCGGSCSDYFQDAINKGADAYITADIKYHTFLDAEGKLLLIDAGHYETEIFSLDEIEKRLTNFISKKDKIKVYKFSGSTNPVVFYNN